MWGAIIGAVAGVGLGAYQIIEGKKTADKMEEQANQNLQLANKQADWMQQNWSNLAKPALLRQQVLQRDAQEASYADAGVISNLGTALVARYYTMRDQNLDLMTKENMVNQEAEITRKQGLMQYQSGMLQARSTEMNAIFSGIGTITSIAGKGSQYSAS